MDLGDSIVCEECAMICTDAYSDEEYKAMVVYGDQGITSKKFDKKTYGDLMNTDNEEDSVIKYNVALHAHDSVSLEKKRRRLNRDIPSEDKKQLNLLNKEEYTVEGATNHDDEIELQEAWTMGMPMIDGDISTMDSEELKRIKDKNKNFLYARAVHANHMIQYHMHEISECQQVVDAYQSMVDGGREMIPLESDQYKNDPVINQHIMQMIDTDIFWYSETFRAILMELRKICNGETATKTSEELNGKESYESAMMCWESLDDSEPTSKKRKTHSQDEATNDKANEMDDKMHTECTANTGTHLNILVDDLQLGADNDVSTLATQETSAKNLVYITNIPEGKLDCTKNVRDSSKNSGKQDDKTNSPLEKSDQVTSNDKLNAYGESERDA